MRSRALTTILVGVVGAGCVFFGYWIGSGKESEVGISGRSSSSSGFKLLAELKKGDSGLAGGVLREEKNNVGKELTFGKEPSKRAESLSAASLIEVVNSGKEVAIEKSKEVSSVATGSVVYAKLTPKEAERPPVEECHFSPGQFPKYRPLFISEVAWAGTPEDSGNEWIELKNASSGPVNAGGYWLLDKAEQIKVHLPSVLVPADGFYLLERGDDAVPGIEADAIYTGGLSNSNETLRLFDPWCNLLDEVVAEPKWPAGESASKRSMERGGNWEWFTYQGSAVAEIFGTPKKENSAPKTPNTQTFAAMPIPSGSSASNPTSTNSAATPATEETTSSQSEPMPEPVATATSLKLLVSKIQTTGGSGKTTEDFVELYNPGPGDFNLKGHRLVKRTKTGTSDTSLKSWTDDVFIVAGASYRWANSSYSGSADVRTSGSIADDNAVALRKGSENTGEVVDAVGWGLAANALVEGAPFGSNPKVNETLIRINNQDTNNNASDFKIE